MRSGAADTFSPVMFVQGPIVPSCTLCQQQKFSFSLTTHAKGFRVMAGHTSWCCVTILVRQRCTIPIYDRLIISHTVCLTRLDSSWIDKNKWVTLLLLSGRPLLPHAFLSVHIKMFYHLLQCLLFSVCVTSDSEAKCKYC